MVQNQLRYQLTSLPIALLKNPRGRAEVWCRNIPGSPRFLKWWTMGSKLAIDHVLPRHEYSCRKSTIIHPHHFLTDHCLVRMMTSDPLKKTALFIHNDTVSTRSLRRIWAVHQARAFLLVFSFLINNGRETRLITSVHFRRHQGRTHFRLSGGSCPHSFFWISV